jgi:PhnB protein
MKELVTYLTFDGKARQAMEFYSRGLGGDLHIMTFGESGQCPGGSEDKVMHAKLSGPGWTLMASDTMPEMPYTAGNNFSIALTCESAEDQDRLFATLGEGGTATMPLQDTFWGARFGMLQDQFGIHWMFNFDHPKPEA